MGEFTKWKSLIFENTPESLAFMRAPSSPSTSSSSAATAADVSSNTESVETVLELIVGLRGVSYLTYYSFPSDSFPLPTTAPFPARPISLNVNDWDTHVSFTPLYLSPSPNHKYLLVATDHHQLYLYKHGTNKRLKVLVGHNCGEYGKPVVVWDPTSSYCFINSEEEHGVYVYSIARETMIERLSAHKGLVRSLSYHPQHPYLVTASYDKSLIIWEPAIL
jgi:WD40 repeat protein